MKIDYSKTESANRVMPGEYEVMVSNYEVITSQKGNQCVQLDYEIRRDVSQECQGLSVRYDNFVFTENAFWRMCLAAKAAGLPDGLEIPDEHPDFFGKVMKGRYLRIVVADRTYNNKTYPSVKEYWATNTSVRQPNIPVMDNDGFMPAAAPDDDFMNIPDGIEDGLPFN